MCGHCASFGIIDGDALRKPTPVELAMIKRTPEIVLAQQRLIGFLQQATRLN